MMNTRYHRRGLLRLLAACPTLATFGWPMAGLAATPPLQAQSLNERLVLISGAGGNIVLFKGSTGLTLIDSGLAEHSAALLSLVDQFGAGLAPQTLINTHWHADHSGGNEALRKRGVRIVAHENTRLWLGADFEIPWRGQHIRPRAPEALPDTTFYESGELDLGGTRVQHHHTPQAHTDGDIFIRFPEDNLIVAGGLLSTGRYPICDIASGGWIGGLLAANQAMLKLADADTLIVPDRGPAVTKPALQKQYDMLSSLYEKMKELAREGYHADDMLAAGITAAYDAEWGDPREFVHETYRGMWVHTYDMGGFI